MPNITNFYKSKVRKRRYCTSCISCNKIIEIGNDCMREQLDLNSFGCMQYNEICIPCWNRKLKTWKNQSLKEHSIIQVSKLQLLCRK